MTRAKVTVGIDLGTTYSVVATVDRMSSQVTVFKNSTGSYTTPSVLAFDGQSIVFGEAAKEELFFGNDEVAAFYKRHLARLDYFERLGDDCYDACQLSALFLEHLIKDIEETNQIEIGSAVISVPAYFTHLEIDETLKAAKLANIEVKGIIHEPTAAALAYGLTGNNKPQTVLFYDLGGGTFDVTIANLTEKELTVLGASGDSQLGGKDFDQRLEDYLTEEAMFAFGDEVVDSPAFQQKLLEIEKYKKQLSHFESISIPMTYQGNRQTLVLERATFEEQCQDLLDRTVTLMASLLEELALTWSKIDHVILVGGSTKMPMVVAYFEKTLGKAIKKGVNVDEAVAIGAAIKVNSFEHFGFESASKAPSFGFESFSDVTAHGMGMIAVNEKGNGYINDIIIPKNTTIPAKVTKDYRLSLKSIQSQMEIFVLQGEDEQVINNTFVNKYLVSGFDRPKNKGEQFVSVTYAYNQDGMVEVSASCGQQPLQVTIDTSSQDLSWAYNGIGTIGYDKICIAIDTSGSMAGEPMRKAVEAAVTFFDVIAGQAEIAVISVANSATCVCPLTKDRGEFEDGLSKLFNYPDGGGNSGHPFHLAQRVMDRGLLIVLADGVWSYQDMAIGAAHRAQETIDIVGIGFGSADEQFLRAISNLEGIGGMTDLANLSQTFSNVAQVIASQPQSMMKLL